jgi:hypothetical protein
METFGKKFTHENHEQDCHECHAREKGRFALKLKDKFDCSACHHAKERIEDMTCDTCHDLYKPKAFGKEFNHMTHEEGCKACHNENLRLKLKSRGDCNACHHEGIDDPEMCEGCHETQSEFFKGAEKYGIEETPSMKSEMEMGCDTCHGDVQKYEPAQARKSCSKECHEADDADYSYDKLIEKGKKTIMGLEAGLPEAQEKLKAAQSEGIEAKKIAKAEIAISRVKDILKFLKKDASYGLHNPGLFGEFANKVKELLKTAGEALNK